jgi:hypothetical protein
VIDKKEASVFGIVERSNRKNAVIIARPHSATPESVLGEAVHGNWANQLLPDPAHADGMRMFLAKKHPKNCAEDGRVHHCLQIQKRVVETRKLWLACCIQSWSWWLTLHLLGESS